MTKKKAKTKNKADGMLTSGDATTLTGKVTPPPLSDGIISNTTTAQVVSFQVDCPGSALGLLGFLITTSFRLLEKCFGWLTRPVLYFAGYILHLLFAVIIVIFCCLWVFFAALRACVYAAFWEIQDVTAMDYNRQTEPENRPLHGTNSADNQDGGLYPDVGNRRERRMRKWMEKRGYKLAAVEEYED